tara:strand:+ start:78 stop:245 length:168 start_codon:yes stop_codon:yes gene_type:complete
MKPMHTYLAAHPQKGKNAIKQDLRSITFSDWILMIIKENRHNLPKQLQRQYEIKK